MGGNLSDIEEIRRRAAEIVKAEEERFRLAPEAAQQATERKGIKFVSAGVLCASPCVTDWLIQSYLDSGSLAVLFAPPGAMKSFVALDIGLSIASNTPWKGNQIRW